jgi:hypothetical protein
VQHPFFFESKTFQSFERLLPAQSRHWIPLGRTNPHLFVAKWVKA